jgi:transketolase
MFTRTCEPRQCPPCELVVKGPKTADAALLFQMQSYNADNAPSNATLRHDQIKSNERRATREGGNTGKTQRRKTTLTFEQAAGSSEQNSFAASDAAVAMLQERARFIRLETVRLIEIAKTGHYSSVFSAAELFAILYYDVMRLRRGEPNWPSRDRFTIGKGHAAVGLFPIYADLAFFPKEWLDSYTRLGSPLGDHPDMRKVPGVDFSSGSIGHALSNGLGMVLAQRWTSEDYRVFCMMGDGEMQEGQVWEAAISAAQHKAHNLIAIIDCNGYQLDGKVEEVMNIEPLGAKWRAFGWETHEVDGHDIAATTELLRRVRADDERRKPCCVIARTIKGNGVSYMEEEPGWHLGYLDPSDAEAAIAEIRSRVI